MAIYKNIIIITNTSSGENHLFTNEELAYRFLCGSIGESNYSDLMEFTGCERFEEVEIQDMIDYLDGGYDEQEVGFTEWGPTYIENAPFDLMESTKYPYYSIGQGCKVSAPEEKYTECVMYIYNNLKEGE